MNPNVTLEEIATDEFEVYLRSTYVGIVYLDFWGTWSVVDVANRGEETGGFDTVEDAVNWMVGW
jgi:hypothetical protein